MSAVTGCGERSWTLDELTAYFAATLSRGDATDAEFEAVVATQVVGSRHATRDTITEALERCRRDDPARHFSVAVWVEAAHNPATDAELLAELAVDDSIDIVNGAAANPGLGAERVAQLLAETAEPALLANPHVDAAILDSVAAQHPAVVARNPAAPAKLLTAMRRQGHLGVLSNPACPRDLLDDALRPVDVHSNAFQWAVLNPALGLDELRELHARISSGDDQGPAAQSAAGITWRRIQHVAAAEDPFNVEARFATEVDVIDPLAAALARRDDTADAVAALLRAGFDGTIGELLDCAGAVTR